MSKKIYHGVKGEEIECNCCHYEKNKLNDKIVSALVWSFWIAGILFMCIQCSSDML